MIGVRLLRAAVFSAAFAVPFGLLATVDGSAARAQGLPVIELSSSALSLRQDLRSSLRSAVATNEDVSETVRRLSNIIVQKVINNEISAAEAVQVIMDSTRDGSSRQGFNLPVDGLEGVSKHASAADVVSDVTNDPVACRTIVTAQFDSGSIMNSLRVPLLASVANYLRTAGYEGMVRAFVTAVIVIGGERVTVQFADTFDPAYVQSVQADLNADPAPAAAGDDPNAALIESLSVETVDGEDQFPTTGSGL